MGAEAIVFLLAVVALLFAQTQHQQVRINRLERRLEETRLDMFHLLDLQE